MHLGRVQLVRPEFRADSDEVTARVVLVANRQRTTAVDGENIHSWEDIIAAENANKNPDEIIQSDLTKVADRLQHARVSSMRLQQAVVARWQKRQTSIQRLTSRLVRWAKSVNMKRLSSCTDVEDQVVLDPHVHPPGHDGHSVSTPRRSLFRSKLIHASNKCHHAISVTVGTSQHRSYSKQAPRGNRRLQRISGRGYRAQCLDRQRGERLTGAGPWCPRRSQ